MNLYETGLELRRLGKARSGDGRRDEHAPYWMGVAADLWRAGDTSCEWMLREGAAGEVYAAGHAESGNDLPAPAFDREGREGRRRLEDHRPQDVRQPLAGLDPLRLPCHGYVRPERAEDRSRLPAARRHRLQDRRDLGHAGHARLDEQRHRDGRRVLPGQPRRPRRAGGSGRRRSLRARRSSPTRSSAWRMSTSAPPCVPATSRSSRRRRRRRWR